MDKINLEYNAERIEESCTHQVCRPTTKKTQVIICSQSSRYKPQSRACDTMLNDKFPVQLIT